jgi:hypothetical protein
MGRRHLNVADPLRPARCVAVVGGVEFLQFIKDAAGMYISTWRKESGGCP